MESYSMYSLFFFLVWLLSLSSIILRFICVIVCISRSFLFIVRLYQNLLHSFTSWWAFALSPVFDICTTELLWTLGDKSLLSFLLALSQQQARVHGNICWSKVISLCEVNLVLFFLPRVTICSLQEFMYWMHLHELCSHCQMYGWNVSFCQSCREIEIKHCFSLFKLYSA